MQQPAASCSLEHIAVLYGPAQVSETPNVETHLTGSRHLTGRVKESVSSRMAEAAQASLKQVPSISLILSETWKVDVPICYLLLHWDQLMDPCVIRFQEDCMLLLHVVAMFQHICNPGTLYLCLSQTGSGTATRHVPHTAHCCEDPFLHAPFHCSS